MALLDYIESSTDGFRILVRDCPPGQSTGSFASLMSDVASQVEHILAAEFKRRRLDPKTAPLYAQMLVGMVALTGQWWLDSPQDEEGRRGGPPRQPRLERPGRSREEAHPAHHVRLTDRRPDPARRASGPGLVPGAASVDCCQPAVGGQAVAGLACTRGWLAGDSSRTRAACRRPMMLRTKSRPDPTKAAMAANPAMRPMVSNA